MNSTGNTDWRHNSPAGVAERDTGDTEDSFVVPYSPLDDDEKDKTDAEDRRPGRNRKRLIGAAIFFLVLIAVGAGLRMMLGGGANNRAANMTGLTSRFWASSIPNQNGS